MKADSIAVVRAQLARCAPDCDVLFIDDGSLDGSGALLEAAGCDVVHHLVNLGYLEALRTGLAVALAEGYEFVVFFDGDGQHRIEDLNKLVEHHRAIPQDDVLIGSRYLGGQRAGSWLRHLVGQSYAFGVRLAIGQTIYDVTSGLKLLNRRAIEIMNGLVLEDGHAELPCVSGTVWLPPSRTADPCRAASTGGVNVSFLEDAVLSTQDLVSFIVGTLNAPTRREGAPMTPVQRLVTGVLVILFLLLVLRFVHQQRLGVSLGFLWVGLLLGALMILAVPSGVGRYYGTDPGKISRFGHDSLFALGHHAVFVLFLSSGTAPGA